ncbi:MAG: hypothetical protein KJO60_01950 [Desulfofustis sp.]|nr:hypothetical protein [Desulfofustis sp.]
MNDRSRTKRRCQEAIILHRPSRDLDQERGSSDYVEDILLQRDYIID